MMIKRHTYILKINMSRTIKNIALIMVSKDLAITWASTNSYSVTINQAMLSPISIK